MLRRAVAGAVPAALVAGLGMPALGALVFLAACLLAVACWVIASGERTDRVRQLMLARHGQAGGPAPETAAPPAPVSRPPAAPDTQGKHPGRRRPLGDRSTDTCQACCWKAVTAVTFDGKWQEFFGAIRHWWLTWTSWF
jgi:hypothetical protein